jgi:hypothetical protein
MVARYVTRWHKLRKAERYAKVNKIAPKHAAILACTPVADTLRKKQQGVLSQLIAHCSTLGLMRVLAKAFREALFGGDSARWIGFGMLCSPFSAPHPIRFD